MILDGTHKMKRLVLEVNCIKDVSRGCYIESAYPNHLEKYKATLQEIKKKVDFEELTPFPPFELSPSTRDKSLHPNFAPPHPALWHGFATALPP